MTDVDDRSGCYGKPFESVWDYPRPPRLERVPEECWVDFERLASDEGSLPVR